MLSTEQRRNNAEAEWARYTLTRSSQLPALTGNALAFVWDVERIGDATYHLITLGDERVWRERARAEDWRRFEQVKSLLKVAYGRRFASLTPTDAAALTLLSGNTLATLSPT
jgi:hypothetical protein